MNTAAVAAALVKMHREIQDDCGYDPNSVTPEVKPLDDLPGFDSMLIPGAVRTLARELGSPLPKDMKIKNLYVSDDGKRKLTINEIAEAFCRTYHGESETK